MKRLIKLFIACLSVIPLISCERVSFPFYELQIEDQYDLVLEKPEDNLMKFHEGELVEFVLNPYKSPEYELYVTLNDTLLDWSHAYAGYPYFLVYQFNMPGHNSVIKFDIQRLVPEIVYLRDIFDWVDEVVADGALTEVAIETGYIGVNPESRITNTLVSNDPSDFYTNIKFLKYETFVFADYDIDGGSYMQISYSTNRGNTYTLLLQNNFIYYKGMWLTFENENHTIPEINFPN